WSLLWRLTIGLSGRSVSQNTKDTSVGRYTIILIGTQYPRTRFATFKLLFSKAIGTGQQLSAHLSRRKPFWKYFTYVMAGKAFFMSGYTDDVMVRHNVLDGRTPFLQKPFTKDSLIRKV